MATPSGSGAGNGPQMSASDKFFRHFQQQVKNIQDRIDRLEGLSSSERADAVDQCLASIATLSSEVQDASSYLPAYDQRTYGDTMKGLSQKLQDVRASFAPRPKFSFKKKPGSAFTAQKNESAMSLSDAAEILGTRDIVAPSNDTSGVTTPTSEAAANATEQPLPPPPPPAPSQLQQQQTYTTAQLQSGHRPSFSQSKGVLLSDYANMHIILPSSAGRATASGTLSNLNRCIIDMSSPTTREEHPFATLTLRNLRSSLLVCGHVAGAAHLTGLSDCVVVVACRQFRMHESRNVDVYLRVGSRPIIEDCSGIRFAPLPEGYEVEGDREGENLWERVDDFKWLRGDQASPNWTLLRQEERVGEAEWREVVMKGDMVVGVDGVLSSVGVGRGGER